MRQLEPIVWTKGIFLSPQHLQQQDRFLEELLHFQVENLAFCPWGFSALTINHSTLAGGAFAIASAAGVFADGLPFEFPGADSSPGPKPFAECFTRDRQIVDLHLAVPQFRERGRNVAATGGDSRYRIETELFLDENTGLSEKPVQVARKNLRLLTDDDPRDGYSTLRVARIRKTDSGVFRLDPGFVPPLLDLRSSDYLTSVSRRLVEVLSARSSAIAGARRQKNQTLADFTTADIAAFWLLATINSALPKLRHLSETRRGHPERLFAAMLELAGALTAFSFDIRQRELPLYEHDDLGNCFAVLERQLHTLLSAVVPANFVALPLKLVQTAIYAAPLDEEKYFSNTKMYLAVKANAPQADVMTKAPQLIKITSTDEIERLVRQALPGVPLTLVASPPSVIPVKLDYQYFSVSQQGPAWDAIVRARYLAAYIPAELPSPQLELLVLLPLARNRE